jgi:hypothetical protein
MATIVICKWNGAVVLSLILLYFAARAPDQTLTPLIDSLFVAYTGLFILEPHYFFIRQQTINIVLRLLLLLLLIDWCSAKKNFSWKLSKNWR